MSMGKFLTAGEKETILKLHKKGKKAKDIAKQLGRAATAVYRVLRAAGVPGRFASKASKTVRNTRPAKRNGQTTVAAGELRQVIDRKREELEALEKALVIVEVGL